MFAWLVTCSSDCAEHLSVELFAASCRAVNRRAFPNALTGPSAPVLGKRRRTAVLPEPSVEIHSEAQFGARRDRDLVQAESVEEPNIIRVKHRGATRH